MLIKDYIRKIKKLNACGEALKDSLNYETSQALWADCKRGDWMLWLLYRVLNLDDEIILRRLTLAKARCVKLVTHLMKDERSRKAVEVAERFGNGTATREELDAAAAAAYNAAVFAAAASAAATAYTDASAFADAYAIGGATRKDMLKQCADIVRELFPDIDEYLKNSKIRTRKNNP